MNYRENCAAETAGDAKSCETAGVKAAPISKLPGAAAEKTETSPAQEFRTAGGSGEIILCPDGKYRWASEFRMMKNPVILFTVLKVLAISALVPALITFICDLSDGFLRAVGRTLGVYLLLMAIFFVLSLIGYAITAAIYGGKYMVLFEMDEKGITHIQQDRQFKKAQGVAWLTMMAGASAGKPGVIGTGLLAGTKNSISSDFKNVRKVICLPRRDTIKLNQLFAKNQIYMDPRDYAFVSEYITSRCTNARIK